VTLRSLVSSFGNRRMGSWRPILWPTTAMLFGAGAWISSWLGGPRLLMPTNTRGSIGRKIWTSAPDVARGANTLIVSRVLNALGHQRLAASCPAPNTESALTMLSRVSEANVPWYMGPVVDTTIMYTLAEHSGRTDGGMHFSYRADVDDGTSSVTGSDATGGTPRLAQGLSVSN
jgi:hypothetical protein